MPRSDWEGRVAVYNYGCPAKAQPTEEALHQLRLANSLWNALVQIHKEHEAAVGEAWAQHPQVAETQQQLAQVQQALDETLTAIAEAKKIGRSRNAVPAELVQAARDLRAQRKTASAAVRTAKINAYDLLKPQFEQLKEQQKAAAKSTYARFVQQDGLYWATYNAVRANFDTALQRVNDQRRAGQPAELRYRRFQGEGTWTVQLQRQADDPARTWEALASNTSMWRGLIRLGQRLQVTPAGAELWEPAGQVHTDLEGWEDLGRSQRRHQAKTWLAVRVASAARRPVWLQLPVALHRPVPPEADITMVQISRRRTGTHFRLSVSFVCRLPAPEPQERPGLVALDLGWRRMEDGSIRVAVWEATRPALLDLPGWMGTWVRHTGTSGELRIPASWCSEMERMHKIHGTRDDKFNVIRTELGRWLAENPAAVPALQAEHLAQWRSPGRLAALVLRWRQANETGTVQELDEQGTPRAVPAPPELGDSQMHEQLEAWRKQDKHLYEWETNTVAQLAASRLEVYRCVAAWMVRSWGTVVAEDMKLPQITKPARPETPDDLQAELARAQSRYAAPGQLRMALQSVVAREGTLFSAMEPAGTTRVHAVCNTWLEQSAAETVVMWCPVCDTGFDQDRNAARNLLRLATGQIAELPGSPSGKHS